MAFLGIFPVIQSMGFEMKNRGSVLKKKNVMPLICESCQSNYRTPHRQPWAYQHPNYRKSGSSPMF